jgi:hypothetical protein
VLVVDGVTHRTSMTERTGRVPVERSPSATF